MKKILYIILIISIISCWDKEIKTHQGLAIAKITQKLGHARGGYSLEYTYKVDNIIFIGSISPTIYKCNYERTFQGKYFPVVYSTINPEKSIILITPNDFIAWGYEFPDSLNWVKKCLK